VVIGYVQYLTGCNQALVQPQGSDLVLGYVTKRPEAEWFDVQRLEQVVGTAKITLDNGATPGCDRAAPKR
jgi:hypothetical protein